MNWMKAERLVPGIGTGPAAVCPDRAKTRKTEEKKMRGTGTEAIKTAASRFGPA
jgi:hypothetical protein